MSALKKIIISILKHLSSPSIRHSEDQASEPNVKISNLSATRLKRNMQRKRKSLLKRQSKATKEKVQRQNVMRS